MNENFQGICNWDITNPYNQYRDGSGLLGIGMGQYHPIADLTHRINMVIQKVNYLGCSQRNLERMKKKSPSQT